MTCYYAKILKLGVMAGLGALLISCGGGGGSPSSVPTASAPPPPPPPPPSGAVESAVTRFDDFSDRWNFTQGFGFSFDMDSFVRSFAGGAAAGDIDNDGDIDLFVTRGDMGPNLLYLNDNGTQFVEAAEAAGLSLTNQMLTNFKHSGPTLADIDGDGDLDLFLGGLEDDPCLIFRNNGDGTFTDVTTGSGLEQMTSKYTISAAFGDYDGDGDLDLAMAHWGTPRDSQTRSDSETLWRNDTDALGIKFTSVSESTEIAQSLNLNQNPDDILGILGRDHDYTFAPSFSDINDDGLLDLLLVTDFNGTQVFQNNGDQNGDGNFTFTDITDTVVINDTNGMGSAIGDYDNDGDMDWFVSSIDGNRLYQNDDGVFSNVSQTAGIGEGGWGWGSCFADFNGDGHLDIYQTNGWDIGQFAEEVYAEDVTRLWINLQNGSFEDRAADFLIDDKELGRGVVCADFDNDGDVDIVQLTANPDRVATFWQNGLVDQNYLKVRLRGGSNQANRHAVGARISIQIDGNTQTRDVTINSNFTSHNPAIQTFGLGSASVIDRLTVHWPDGAMTDMSQVNANQTLSLEHPTF